MPRRLLFAVAAAAGLGATVPGAAADGGPPVTVRDERVTVRAEGTPLTEVLGALAREARIEIRGVPLAPAAPVREVTDLPLEDAFRRLLGEQSFTVVYGRDGRVRAVRLLGGSDDTVVLGGPPVEVPPPQVAGPLPASEQPVPVRGRLARAVGGPTSSFRGLVELALASDDDDVRRDAVRAGLDILADEPELRDAVLHTFETASIESLAGWLERSSGHNAARFAEALAQSAPPGTIRAKAEAIVQHLRSGTSSRRAGEHERPARR